MFFFVVQSERVDYSDNCKYAVWPGNYLLAWVVPLEFHTSIELDQRCAVQLQSLPLHQLHRRVLRKQLELIKLLSCWVLQTWTCQHFSSYWIHGCSMCSIAVSSMILGCCEWLPGRCYVVVRCTGLFLMY